MSFDLIPLYNIMKSKEQTKHTKNILTKIVNRAWDIEYPYKIEDYINKITSL